MADDDDPIEQGFREAPNLVTLPCLTYMTRVTELRSFISFFFGVVKVSASFANNLTSESRERFLTEAIGYQVNDYNFSSHRQLVNEIILSRAVETFDLYVLAILKCIFEAKPEMLKSEGEIEVAKVFDLRDFDEIVAYIAERKLHELSYKPLSELSKYIRSRTGIELFRTNELFEIVLLASEVTVTPAVATRPNFPAGYEPQKAVSLRATFSRVPEVVFQERGTYLVQSASPGISTSKPRFSFKALDLPWPIRAHYRIKRADGEEFEVTSVAADGISRVDVSVVQLGRPRQ